MFTFVILATIVGISLQCAGDEYRHKGQCVKECPGGTFPDDEKMCAECEIFCKTFTLTWGNLMKNQKSKFFTHKLRFF